MCTKKGIPFIDIDNNNNNDLRRKRFGEKWLKVNYL